MSNRWQMNRIGFVNFWLYDEETFSFSDGKLLLRGQNGSGKSITTQSFIPFILDGDRTPSRLDPFGSSDRKMEYYFLGENEKEEATGYLFLEFKRENLEQYRTIGIGQRAQRGKPLSFWGFVILDGRRIGYDLQLYREVGANKLPLTKKELKEKLGAENFYTEAQREYMEMVNRYIFGFASLEQYDQFIRLLIKIRAPKLSKEFKPSRVYDILNDSLQTLSDEDMRAMVEAMEKMDDIQNRLEHLRASFKDLQIIRNEYIRYNRYMLGKKAEIYLDEKKRAEREQEKLDQKTEERDQKIRESAQWDKKCARLSDEREILKKEKEVLPIDDLERSVESLEEARRRYYDAEKEWKRLEQKLEEIREHVLRYDGEKREIQGRIDWHEEEAGNQLAELSEANGILKLEAHPKAENIFEAVDWQKDLQEIQLCVRELEKSVKEGRNALRDYQQRQKAWDEEEAKLQTDKIAYESAGEEHLEARKMEDACRDELVEQFYILQTENRRMQISQAAAADMAVRVQNYQEPGDKDGIRDIFYHIWSEKNNGLAKQRMSLETRQEILEEKRRILECELEEIQAMETPVPVRNRRTEEARARLREKKIYFLPFYEAVEFAENTDPAIRNQIETQLADAGLLDALVVPEKEFAYAQEALKELSDVLICPTGMGGACFPHLTPAETETPVKKAAACILRHIGEEEQECYDFVLGMDGYFRNGMLRGYSQAEEEASYVGAAARKRKKERLLSEKERELQENEEALSSLKKQIAELSVEVKELKIEYERFPSFDNLNRAVDLRRKIEEEVKRTKEIWEKQEQAALSAKNLCKEAEQSVIRCCRPLPYSRRLEVYEEVLDVLQDYEMGVRTLEKELFSLTYEKSRLAYVAEAIEKEEETREAEYGYQQRAKRDMDGFQTQIKKLEEYLEDPKNKERAERLKKLIKRLDEIEEERQEAKGHCERLKGNVELLEQHIAEMKAAVTDCMEKEALVRGYFEEELSLGLVMKRENDTLYDAAKKASACIRENDRQRSGVEMTAALMKTFSAHMGSLSGYGSYMEECFQDENSMLLRGRQRIVSVWNGQKLYLEEFYTVLKEAIESTEMLIQEKDRELFEGILADTLSRKLSNRIRESRSWIKDMSALMKGMDTSMALTFSLDWKPRMAEGEQELDTKELEKILSREKELLTDEDIERVSLHFRNKIQAAKQNAVENGEAVNYMELVRDALDYRKWFQFHMNYYRGNENKKELTNGAFNRFSGGEKAMAMYVPLFAAINAQYKKAENKDHPRIIALDEAFAGVDDKNISSMFELVEHMKFDYIMNSQVLWGCYETVKNLRIAELLRPANSDVVTVIYYHWNGRERSLDEQ